MSKIMQAALDPSCLLCLTPDGWYSPLRQGVIWPGSPRNFATEPATWYVPNAVGDGENVDFTIRFSWKISGNPSTLQRIFYSSSATDRVGIFATTLGALQVNSNLFGASSIGVVLRNNNPLAPGEHVIHVWTDAAHLYGQLDNETVVSSVGVRTGGKTTSTAPQTTMDAEIIDARQINATTSSVIWMYPESIEERLRLVTYTNVLIMPGYFGAANSALGWSIKTALPAGLTGTVLAKINGAVVTDPPQWNRTAATFTAAASATLDWLMVFDTTLTAGQIAYLSN